MQKNVVLIGFVLFAVFAAAACGDDSGKSNADYSIAEQQIQGEIVGEEWTFVEGAARPSAFDENELSIELYAEDFEDPCSLTNDNEKPSVIATIPYEAGEWPLSLQTQTVTFVEPPSNNIIVVQGKLRIDAIDDTTVKGGLHGNAAEDGAVDGTFELTMCE